MCSNMWSRSGSGGECVTTNIMPPCSKTMKTLLPKNRRRQVTPQRPPHWTARPKLHGIVPQLGIRTLWLGRKGRVHATRFPLIQNEQRKQVILKYVLWHRPTPDIIAAVANANQRKKPAQVRTSRCTVRSGNRTSRDDSPCGEHVIKKWQRRRVCFSKH